VLPQVFREVGRETSARQLFVSIAAGVPLRRLEEGLGLGTRVIRVMPNTPALLGKGVSVLVRGTNATEADLRAAMRVFRAVGDALVVGDERLLDAVTGLSGSGPAYVYRFAEALIEAGARQGLDPALAGRLAFGTIEGAAAMLVEARMTPRELREMVSSPGGTTLAGLAALDRAGFMQAVTAAVGAATERSRELGGR
jgi:pyrroline-5-carboxylate reductase